MWRENSSNWTDKRRNVESGGKNRTEYSGKWLEYYEQYKKKLFGRKELSLARIVVYQQKSQVNTDKAQEKLKIWNGCMSDIIVKEFVKEYNQILEKKIQLEENKVFSENKKEIAEDILKRYLRNRKIHIMCPVLVQL